MIKATSDLFNDDYLNTALTRFGIDKENLKDLGGLEVFVYEYQKDNIDFSKFAR